MTSTRRQGLLAAALYFFCLTTYSDVKLICPAGYLPNVPFLARVEVHRGTGGIDRELWNAEATLESDTSGVTLSTNRVVLRNGLGTALLTISGNAPFILRARVGGESATRAVTYAGGGPVANVSGVLAGSSSSWSGVVNVTGNVTVPVGHTLTIAPGTLVIMYGTGSGTAGTKLVVNGALQALGTESAPVTITASEIGLNWGQIAHESSQPSRYEYTMISKAGRAPGEGHTGTGPAFRVNNSTVTFTHSVISDLNANGSNIGKMMMASGSTLTFEGCVLARARMGPEIQSTGLLCTNSYIMEMNGPDDSDGIYLHNAGSRTLLVTGCVFAGGDDDAIDTLDSNVAIENSILRDWPNPSEDAKGVSAFNGDVSLHRVLIANCFAGVSTKSSGPLANLRLDHCTITAADTGVAAATKANASAGNIAVYMTNCIVRASDTIRSDFGPEKFAVLNYCNLGETWPGVGNSTADPLLVSAATGNYRLQPDSPCIDAGDPAAAPDPDGSRTDVGFYTGESGGESFYAAITGPASGGVFLQGSNVVLTAVAGTSSGAITQVEFFSGKAKLGQDSAAPYSLTWSNVATGEYELRAVATRDDGLMATSPPVSISVISADGPSTNVLVSAGSVWKFLDNGTDQGSAWAGLAFNDAGWKSGAAKLGYGDGDEQTVISFGPSSGAKYPTTYFRRAFLFSEELGRVQQLVLDVLRDDGAIVYLNGQEVHRLSMPTGPVDYRTYATTASEYGWETTTIPVTALRVGTNVIAAEVHQGNAASTDLAFDLALTAVLSAPTNARPLVAILSPAGGTIFSAPASIALAASASDPDGTVTNVSYYANNARIASGVGASFAFQWENVPAGEYALTAVAIDNFGLARTSGVVAISVTSDTAPPVVIARTPVPGRVTNLAEVVVTFSKPVTGVDASDLSINGIPAGALKGGGSVYTFSFPALGSGNATLRWAANHGITDTVTPPKSFDSSGAGATWDYQLVDTEKPEIKTLLPVAGSTVPVLTNLAIEFNEPVTGVNASDLLINGVAASAVNGASAGPYRFTFAPPAPGAVAVTWAGAHGIADLSGNAFAGANFSYLVDTNQVGVVISEIMYHPASEQMEEQYIELFNRGAAPVELTGWRFSDGVNFTFTNLTLRPGGYLVVAADLAAFKRKYPAVTNVVGNWTGTLSKSREDIDLDDARGNRVDSVRYADEGDWALRERGSLDRGHRGWGWFSEHDGLGKSLELINPNVSNNSGQNWAASTVMEGTPGRANSVFRTDTAPIIEEVAHSPVVPKSTESVRISARVTGTTDQNATMVLSWRLDGSTPPPFTTSAMRDDGQGGDILANDRIFTATIPPQTNDSVVEFYITVSDSAGRSRTWPAAAIASPDGIPGGQSANALYQVDDSEYTGNQPLYKIVMTENERLELQAIDNNVSGAAASDAQMNATFISIDGTGTEFRYLTGVRNRGHGTRTAKPNNFRVNFRSDDTWKGVLALNLNSQFTYTQVLGAALHVKSGIVGAYSRAVQLRVNNANLAFTGGIDRTYGSYAANEAINADWAERHFPNDSEGNIYRALRDLQPPEFDYRTQAAYPSLYGPENKNSYTNTWFKVTNESEDDWSDLIAMLRVLGPSGTEPFTSENVGRVIDVEQWLRHLAVMNLLGNSETSPNSGYNDDYFIYRGLQDRRFALMYYDLDQIVGFNGSFSPTASLFTAADNRGAGRALGRLLTDPAFQPIYYAQLRNLIETSFSQNEFNATVDQMLGDWVPQAVRDQMKRWMDSRRTYVLSQLPAPSPAVPSAVLSGGPRTPTPQTTAQFVVGGEGVTHYRYSLNGGPFGAEAPVASAIQLSDLANGTNTLRVIGRNAAGLYQPTNTGAAFQWVVDRSMPSLRLNEVIASRSGNAPDQIELFNDGPNALDLAGFRLSDSRSNPNKYVFASGTLAAGAYIVLDANQLGFGLDAAGETLFLFNKSAAGGGLLDQVEFGLQLVDLSIGRVGQSGEWVLNRPTFGTANVVQALGNRSAVRINEWLAAGIGTDDFVELYNPEPLPVALGGSYLTDQRAGDPTRSRIVPLSFVAARGHALFTSGNGNQATEINFSLAAEQGEIALLAPDLSLIDMIVYGPQLAGVANGRCPDGGPAQKPLALPTPGGANECPVEAAPPQTVTLVPFNQTWRYDASGTDRGTAWKETNYNDTAWSSGPALIGFEDNALPEPLLTTFPNPRVTTYYFRTSFRIDPALKPSTVQIATLIDDGAAFYLNGQEIGTRYNLAPGASAQTFALSTVEAGYQTFEISPTLLRSGDNLLAAEVHQVNGTSSDMVFGMRVDALVFTNNAGAAGVVLNEVLARNASFKNAAGRTASWVELYNPSSNSVDLAGMSLSRDVANPLMWVFPAGSVIGSKGYLVIECDDSRAASLTNSGFSLKNNGGSVYLYNSPGNGGGLRSSISYGIQASDWAIGPVPDGAAVWMLTIPTPGAANRTATLGLSQNLRINEWMADPADGNDWLELFNSNPEPVRLDGLGISDTPASVKQRFPGLSFIGTGAHAFLKLDADSQPSSGPDHLNFGLAAGGEAIVLTDPRGGVIDAVSFGPQTRGASEGRLPDGSGTRLFFPQSPTPGTANYLPIGEVLINEVLTHTDLPLEDAIEFYNPGSTPVDLGGWFLSDSATNLRKYQIPTNTIVPARGYTVFYEGQFNSDDAFEPFAFSSASGEDLFLSEANNGLLTGYRASARFGAARNGVSFGRVETSQGPKYVALAARTFGKDNPATVEEFRGGRGAMNAPPLIGPVVITEIMYNPPPGNDQPLEFVELRNISSGSIALFDPAYPTNTWRLRGGVDYDFPTNITVGSGEFIILVAFDPLTDTNLLASFRAAYGAAGRLFGPFQGSLNNSGESVELEAPDTPDAISLQVPYVAIDRVDYAPGTPWPVIVEAANQSLQKISDTAFGNEPLNWTAASPTLGASLRADRDNDGLPDAFEEQNGFDPRDPADAALDADGDGMSNLQEYLAGTDPRNPQSTLRLGISHASAEFVLHFTAAIGRSYEVLGTDALGSAWRSVAEVPAASEARVANVTLPISAAKGYFQVRLRP